MRAMYHVSEFLVEEMEARGWSVRDVAMRMGGEDPHVDELALELLIAVGPENPKVILGTMAESLARAFGVSPQLFTNLDRAWAESLPSPQREEALEARQGHGDKDE